MSDQVEAIYANGQITLSLKEGAAYGKTYKVTVRAYDGAPAVTLRVAVPAEKKSNISASIKASGFIDVIREGTVITVTPTFVNAFVSDVDADSMSLKFYRKDGKTWTEVKGNEIPFACDPDENGRFVITAKESLVHTDKYQVELVARIDGKEILSKRINLTVKMGSAKLTVKASDTTLFAKDKNDRALFWFETKDATLNEVTRVAFKDAKQAATFELIDYGDGTYAIGFKNGKVNEKMVGKSVTVKLNVFIEGNETAKANDAVSVKLTVVK